MNRMRGIVAVAALAIAGAAQAGENVKSSWKRDIGNWELEELRGEVTGSFGFCVIKTVYVAANSKQKRTMRSSAVLLQMMYGGQDNMGVSLVADDWTTTEDKTYRLKMRFEDGHYYTVNASGLKTGGILAITQPNAEWLKRMMVRSSVDIYVNDKWIGDFRLDGSANAIKELMRCAIAGREEAGGGDTFGDTAPAGETF